MADQLTKLRPDRDLQCYFQEPTAVAALSGATANGFTVSGCWRQPFDWAVVEWNRDNVFEHPTLRNLPDGNLSGIQLSYVESRTNCMAMDSTEYDSVGWSYLRIWEDSDGPENFHMVPLMQYATPVGGYTPATATFTLQGTPTAGDYIELAWLDQHQNYQFAAGDTLATALVGLAGFINANSAANGVTASVNGAQITLTYNLQPGNNGNRIGVYGGISGAQTESWSPAWAMFVGGVSPQQWQVNLDFGNLIDSTQQTVPTQNVRKVRWTWAADLQFQNYQGGEFAVSLTDWQVTGGNITYSVAGPGSQRIEDDSSQMNYSGSWTLETGNYSGGSIHHTTNPSDSLSCSYMANETHQLYVGTRYSNNGGNITVQVDSNPALTVDLCRPLEDVLIRVETGAFAGGVEHVITVTHTGAQGTDVYFDFLEIAYPTENLPTFPAIPDSTLATDWDTNNSLAIAPERTAWLIDTLGFKGRANHYAGALWFYELYNFGNQYATATIVFSGTPEFGGTTELALAGSSIQHVNLISDTAETIATCFALWITAGSSAAWAQATGATLTITARAMGSGGNSISIAASTGSSGFTASVSQGTLSGGADGVWYTDLNAVPRINRAARDWSTSFFQALSGYGTDVTASFSMELGNGDDRAITGIAQMYPDGPVWVNTPALQTNFSPASLAFWQEVYAEMAGLMTSAGVDPYLQFGEVQWWYFADASGMPFYDAYTTSTFAAQEGRPMAIIPSQSADPSAYPVECVFLPGLIGQFTRAIATYVQQQYFNTRFEVLYPVDTNNTPLNEIINFPTAYWTPSALACLKTENFTYTGDRDLDQARQSIQLPMSKGFPVSQGSHLIGISDPTTPWQRERLLTLAAGVEPVVLFALDQFCLIGTALPLDRGPRISRFMGN
ncbi:MAG: hypothetical protein ACLQU1_32260 [Bryobacteraceae bacterium]